MNSEFFFKSPRNQSFQYILNGFSFLFFFSLEQNDNETALDLFEERCLHSLLQNTNPKSDGTIKGDVAILSCRLEVFILLPHLLLSLLQITFAIICKF